MRRAWMTARSVEDARRSPTACVSFRVLVIYWHVSLAVSGWCLC